MAYTGFISLCSSPIVNSPFPRGYSLSPGAESFHELLEWILETGDTLSPPSVSLTPTLHPSDLIELYKNPQTHTRTHYLDKNTSHLLSELEKIGESEISTNELEPQLTNQHLAVTLRLNSPPALKVDL